METDGTQTKLNMYKDRQIRAYVVKHNLINNVYFLARAKIGVYYLGLFLQDEIRLDDKTKLDLVVAIMWHIKTQKVIA